MSNVFGFVIKPPAGAGDFLPIIKYDARAGRIFRVDRIETPNGFISEPVDITNAFKAVADFANIESGWIDFATGGAPSFVLVPRGNPMPNQPSSTHKQGIRFMVKLAKDCGGDKPVREVAGTSRAFLEGAQIVVQQYLDEAAKYPGQLPVIVLDKTTPVRSGSGERSSTAYYPTWRIVFWVQRPADLQPQARGTQPQGNVQQRQGNGGAPATGSSRATAPPQSTAPQASADDFG